MASVGIKLETPQAVKLQGLIQNELADREWAERSDTVMAEYVTVMLANSKTGDQINEELVDLIGSEYDQSFVTWLFETVRNLDAPAVAPIEAAQVVEEPVELLPASTSSSAPPAASSRLVSSALASATSEENKRKRSPGPAALDDQRNKRMAAASGPIPVQGGPGPGPRGNGAPMRGGRPPFNGPGGNFRGGPPSGPGGNFRGGPPSGPGGNFRGGPPGFRPHQGFNAAMAAASQGRGGNREAQMMAEMLQAQQAQMMQMQAMMHTMAQMNQGGPQQQPNVRPQRPPKIPAGVKLGSHTMGGTPAPSSTGPIPTKPSDSALCKFSVGCSNARCPYSHPSPVADELSGVVLSADACPEGIKCADKDCIKSHVSPAVVHGDKAGQSRMLCKFQNCNNPSCPFRHEDAQGNAVPPPALANPEKAKKTEAPKSTMDGALESSPFSRPCKFGAACTRADCKFQHANRASRGGHKSTSFAPNPSAKPFSPAERPFAVSQPEGVALAASEEVNVEQVV